MDVQIFGCMMLQAVADKVSESWNPGTILQVLRFRCCNVDECKDTLQDFIIGFDFSMMQSFVYIFFEHSA